MPRPVALLVTLLLAGLLAGAAGCGGSGGDGAAATEAATTGGEEPAEETETEPEEGEEPAAEANPDNVAYQGAYELCSDGTVEELAGLFGIDPPTEDAVAEAIAEQVGGGLSAADFEQGRLGCLAALEERG
jgi:hypothetical protein